MATRLPYYAGEGDIYSQIMQQMQGQPLAFANPYGAGFTGGYNPRLYDRPPVVAPTPAPDTSGLLGGGDSGGFSGMPASGGAMNPASMISAGQALQGYGRSFGGFAPFGTIAGLLGYGLTNYGINQLGEMERAAAQAEAEAAAMNSLSQLSSAEVGKGEAQAIADALGYGLAGLSSAEVGQAEADAVAAAETAAAAESMGNALAADIAAANQAAADASSGYGGTGAASSDVSGGYGGVDSGGYSGDGSGGYYYKGGKVTTNGLLTDVDPPGPDEGYGALQVGEYVIKKSTAKKLGDKKLNALNQGRATIKMSK
jgi:hypothetical protein